MATRSNQKERRRPRKTSIRRSLLGQIDKTKEYAIYWLSDDPAPPENYYETLGFRLRGIIDYLHKISDADDLRKADDLNIFLVIEASCFVKHQLTLTARDNIRAIYVYDLTENDQFDVFGSKNGQVKMLLPP